MLMRPILIIRFSHGKSLVEITRFFEKTEILMVVVYINSCFQQIDSDHESNLDSNCEAVWMKVLVMGNKPLYVTTKWTFYFQQFFFTGKNYLQSCHYKNLVEDFWGTSILTKCQGTREICS